jgi:hypothetical protein
VAADVASRELDAVSFEYVKANIFVEFQSAVKERHGRGAEDVINREWHKQCLKGN